MPYLLDTDWNIHVLAGNADVVATIERLSGDRIFASRFSVAELYEGAFRSPNPQARLQAFRHFISGYRTAIPDDETAERFAETRSTLRRRGDLIPDLDLLIAATALRHDLTVLSFNTRHLARVPNLRIFAS